MTSAYSVIAETTVRNHSAARMANSFGRHAGRAPTIAAPWKNPANITYIDDSRARS